MENPDRSAFSQLLRREGHTPLIAANGKEAVALARDERPDAAFLDVLMPGLDGLDALKIIHREQPDLPVVVMTAHGTMQTAMEALRLGAFDYLGKPVELERVREVAIAAQADDFVMELPDGYETRLGEGGARLSMGQRQRLTIARALFEDPAFLVLDEATSALDAESEHQVQQAMKVLLEGRGSLVIAHRLATIREADRIVVLDKGRIVEEGDHGTLLALGGLYAHLHGLQFQE